MKKYRFNEGLHLPVEDKPKPIPKPEKEPIHLFRSFYPDGSFEDLEYKRKNGQLIKLTYNEKTKRFEPENLEEKRTNDNK